MIPVGAITINLAQIVAVMKKTRRHLVKRRDPVNLKNKMAHLI
jgi:predicted protein tyrosine phosphatase